nr:uncharacterized protein LOC129277674 [Lytechinus pictus]
MVFNQEEYLSDSLESNIHELDETQSVDYSGSSGNEVDGTGADGGKYRMDHQGETREPVELPLLQEEYLSDSLESNIHELDETQSVDYSGSSGDGNAQEGETETSGDDTHGSVFSGDLPDEANFDEQFYDAESWDGEQSDEGSIHADLGEDHDEDHGENGEEYHDAEDEYDGDQFDFNESMNEPLFAGSHISKAESLIMVLSFIMRHCLSASAVTHLFDLLNTLFGTYIFKSTKCILRQIFCNNFVQLSFHFYCTVCYSYVQSYDVISEDNILCPHCTQPCMVKDLSHGNFFVTTDLKLQVRALFERSDISPHLQYRSSRHKVAQDNIEDIYDGEFYRNMMKDGEPLSDNNNFSYTFNSDGFPCFKSSKYSLWPIYIMINELPPRLRTKNLILAGVWFSKCEPKMEIFLEKFTQEANKLSEEGVFWKEGNVLRHSRLFGICCCADAPARSSMQNRMRFNGYYGCGLCYHPGKAIDRVVKYPIDVCDYNNRSDEEMLQDMTQALEDGRTVRGIKGPSPLINLSYFPICWGFPIDYMHCLLLGVVKQLSELWFASPAASDFYIGSKKMIKTIDQRLKPIKPPSFVARATRPISERKFWKASEWFMWLLFYSVPCLKGILPTQYFNHLILLVEATFILLQKSLSIDELEQSDILLLSFVCRFQILYGAAAMTYNVHSLTHLSKCVSLWGPMWTHSCFAFEAANHQVKRQLHGNRGVIMQAVRKFLLMQTLPLYIEHPAISPRVKIFCERMFNKRGKKANLDDVFENVNILGCGKTKICTVEECDALTALGHRIDQNTPVLSYSRFSKNGMMFCIEGYRAGMLATRNNEFFLLPDDKVGKLLQIYLLNNHCVLLFKVMILNEDASFRDDESNTDLTHIRQCIGIAPNVEAVNANDVIGNCIVISMNETEYIGIFPNYVAFN